MDNLPDELHYKFLLNSSYKDIISYCATNREARRICNADTAIGSNFWSDKAFLDFGVKLNLVPSSSRSDIVLNNRDKYIYLAKLDKENNGELVTLALQSGSISAALNIAKKMKLSRYSHNTLHPDPAIREILREARKYGPEVLAEMLEIIVAPYREIGINFEYLILESIDAYLEAIESSDTESLAVLENITPFYKYNNLLKLYNFSIENGDIKLLDYIRNNSDLVSDYDFDELQNAIAYAKDWRVIDYFAKTYPGAFDDYDLINGFAFHSLRNRNYDALFNLIKFFPDRVDYDFVMDKAIKFKAPPHVMEALRTARRNL